MRARIDLSSEKSIEKIVGNVKPDLYIVNSGQVTGKNAAGTTELVVWNGIKFEFMFSVTAK